MEIFYTLSEIEDAAKKVLSYCAANKIYTFNGELGAGKTTFIKAICRQLGVSESITSPTYSIIQEYRTGQDLKIYHMDFYRINSLHEAVEAGAEEIFASGDFCMIEWPNKIIQLLPEDVVEVNLTILKEQQRKMVVQLPQ
ncbi:MAG: tRNA (adenosine(37)-N6)-threonylcarbamoyltransferase complex ATPase subunit type 1 TsaE [Bacteroidota bacterium]|nr:tRNA (adenosine(37)-N6)-threonylcarbamoyltransferase complex ATPase subunit type 1 TsaE [Bacteroidota bacterium]